MANALDGTDLPDPLAHVRDRFARADGVTYLDGNSLGPPAVTVPDRLARVADEWATGLVGSWNDADWVGLPRRCSDLLAGWLGADPAEVAVTDSISVNLAKLLGAALAMRPDRRTILTVADGFPTDSYVARGVAGLAGIAADVPVEVVHATPAALPDHLDEDVAVVSLPHVDYRTGARLDVPGLTRAAHDVGALALWDAAHSAGALELRLAEWDVDLAVGCSYKFLNAGPGGPGWVFAARRHLDQLANPVPGWFGHAAPFEFDARYVPAPDAQRFLAGTPSVLAFAAFEEALLALRDVDPAVVERQAGVLTTAMLDLLTPHLPPDVEVVTPRDPAARGAQVTLRLEHAWPVCRALADRGVVGDHRPPDLLRLGLAPLVTAPEDVRHGAEVLLDVLATEAWRDPRHRSRPVVP